MRDTAKKLRHDIRGAFQTLLLSTEVLRVPLQPDEQEMFLSQVVEACERLGGLVGQVEPQRPARPARPARSGGANRRIRR